MKVSGITYVGVVHAYAHVHCTSTTYRVSDRSSDAIADVDEGVWYGRRLNQVGPWPSINIYQLDAYLC